MTATPDRPMPIHYEWLQPGLSKWDPPQARHVGLEVWQGGATGDCTWEEAVKELLRVVAELAEAWTKADAEMERVKACEHIAEGVEGWEVLRDLCPSTAAVAVLRDELAAERQAGERWKALAGKAFELLQIEHCLFPCRACRAFPAGEQASHAEDCPRALLLADPDGHVAAEEWERLKERVAELQERDKMRSTMLGAQEKEIGALREDNSILQNSAIRNRAAASAAHAKTAALETQFAEARAEIERLQIVRNECVEGEAVALRQRDEAARQRDALGKALRSLADQGCGVIHSGSPRGTTCLDVRAECLKKPERSSEGYKAQIFAEQWACMPCRARAALIAAGLLPEPGEEPLPWEDMESKLLREVEESRRITGEDLAKRVGASESGEEPKR